MSADLLRKTAADMRAKADAATVFRDASSGLPLPWTSGGLAHAVFDLGGENVVRQARVAAVPHIAAWDPTVALAIADWLDAEADEVPPGATESKWGPIGEAPAFCVARAWWGEDRP